MAASEFWAKKLGLQQQPAPVQPRAPQQASANEPAWWQAAPATRQYQPQQHIDGNTQLPGGVTIQQLSQMDASQLSTEALEMVAQFKLQNPKYSQQCPHCGPDGNFMQSGNSMARCFNCGYSTRDVHGETGLQPTSKLRGSSDSLGIDGGNGSGVVNGQGFGRMPQEYFQRANPNSHGV